MPRTCTVCRHPQRTPIDEALILGQSLRNIAKRFGTSVTALFRHEDHIPTALAASKAAQEENRSERLLDTVRKIEGEMTAFLTEAKTVMTEAKTAGDSRLRLWRHSGRRQRGAVA